jgi:alpha/beta superfamily hydrolase
MKTHFTVLLLAILSLTSCLRLDDQFFNTQTLESYKLDAYEGERELPELPDAYAVDADKIHLFSLQSDDDGDVQTIYAVYVGDTARIAQDTVIVYCHGNKHHMDLYWNRAKLLAHVGGKHRYGVLMMDYRGYGMSTGTTTESGLSADVNACMQWLKDRGLTSDRTILYGYSLGSAPASRLSAEPRALTPAKLLLEAPFASAEVMVQDAALLSLPVSYFTDVRVDNVHWIQSVDQPFCWIHGIDDDFLNIETHGEVVYYHYHGQYQEAHRVPEAAHNNVPAVMGYEEYVRVVGEFVRR